MEKEKFERIKLEIIAFRSEDVILTSTFGNEEDEAQMMPGH